VVDSVDGLNVREESVTEPGTLRGALDQTGNVGNTEVGGVRGRWVPEVCEVVVTCVGDCCELVAGFTHGLLRGRYTRTPRPGTHTLAPAERGDLVRKDRLLVRLNRAEGVVFRSGGLGSEEVEKTGFSDVR